MNRSVAACALGLMALASCTRKEPTQWQSHVALPLARGSVGLDDLVPDSLLAADASGLWHLVLSESLSDFDVDSLVAMPDTLIEKEFEVPFVGGPYAIPPGQEIINQPENTTLTTGEVALKEVIAKSGYLEYTVRSYVYGQLQCLYSLPGVTLNGQPTLIDVHTQPGSQSAPYEQSGVIDLAGYTIDLTGQSGNEVNKVYSELIVKVDPAATGPAMVSGGDAVEISLHFADPLVSYARGYFGQHQYTIENTVDFASEIDLPSGTINLDQVNLNFSIRNAVGADARLNFGTIRSINSTTGAYILLNHDQLLAPVNITRAIDTPSGVNAVELEFDIDENNSNVDQFIEILPDKIALTGTVEINPLGDISDGNDFIYTSQPLGAEMHLDIPLCVGLSGLELRDTLAITSDAGVEAEGELVLLVNNGFPFVAGIEAVVIDGLGNHVLVLIHEQQVAAMQNEQPERTALAVPLSAEVLAALVPGHRVALRILIDTPSETEFVKLYKHYTMDFMLLADASVQWELD